MTTNTNTVEFQTWFAGVQKIVADHYKNDYPTLIPETMIVNEGNRYIKIVSERWQEVSGNVKKIQSSAFAFVDKTTGDVLKAAQVGVLPRNTQEEIYSSPTTV